MNETVLQCVGVTKSFGDFVAVRDVTFDVYRGEIVAILGSSGCGKTTVLRLIAGLERPDAGQILIRGEVASTPQRQTPPDKRGIGMVVQEYALFPHMTVRQNVAFGLNNLSNDQKKDRVAEVMSLVRLENLQDRYPHELSGGQQQRIALARTMAPRPSAVLLDEPFSNIDAGLRSEVRRDVEEILRVNDIAAVLVTHDRDEAFAIADRVAVMSDGELHQVDTPEAVYHLPSSKRVAQMTATCDFIEGVVLQDGTVETEAGILAYDTHSSDIKPGSSVELVIHPDDFGIDENESGAMIVQAREFRGDATVLMIALPSGATLRCRQDSHCAITSGRRVDLILNRPGPFAAFSA